MSVAAPGMKHVAVTAESTSSLPVLPSPKLLCILEELLVFSCYFALNFLDVFLRWQFFGLDPAILQNLSHALVVLHVFRRNDRFTFEIILLHVEVRNLRGKVLRLDRDGREEV